LSRFTHERMPASCLCDGRAGAAGGLGDLLVGREAEPTPGVVEGPQERLDSHLDESITNVKEYVLVYSRRRDAFAGLIGEVRKDEEPAA